MTRHLLLTLALLVLVEGCGAAPSTRMPKSGSAQGATTPAFARSAPDRDADGIPSDEVQSAPPPPPAEPAPAGNLVAAPAGAPAKQAPAAPGPEKKQEAPSDPAAASAPHDTQMLIYTARIAMAVYQVEQGLAAVEKVARDMGGYLSVKHDREITVRVPRARFEPTLAAIDKIGDVLHRDVQAQDVTDEYVDLEIRIKNARAMQVRLKQLLEKAAVKEALEIEKELRRVTEELELLEGKIKLLKDKIAYSTITVVFEARGSSIQATKIRLPFPWLQQLGLPTLLQLQESK
ncbi:MAG: DUF4349 domain-containing protein [Deltaproteobacteria bacterium]|nr:DUF4349 domain-containing protein [Deltaproteobacteria bacterium]